ncbi:MAG: signal peptidase, partial [Rhodobacterales bacterium]
MRAVILSLLLAIPAAADTASVVTQHIRPGFAAFAAQAKALAAVDSCDPAQLRPAFHATYDAWLAVAHLPLGPAEEEGRSLAILFWPDPKALGPKAQRTLLTGDPAALT